MNRILIMLAVVLLLFVNAHGQDNSVATPSYRKLINLELPSLGTSKVRIDSMPDATQFDSVLTKSFIKRDDDTSKSLKQWLMEQQPLAMLDTFKAKKFVIIDFKMIAKKAINMPLAFSLFNVKTNKLVEIKLDFSIEPTVGTTDKSAAEGSAATDLASRDEILKEVSPLMKNTDVKWQFIAQDLFVNASRSGLLFPKQCIATKEEASLPGEYIVVYDARVGSYYGLKRLIRLKTSGDESCDKKYIEYYKRRSSMFYTPPVGSQLLFVVINVDGNYTVTAGYSDNNLQLEGTFKSTTQAFNTASNSIGAAASDGAKDMKKTEGLNGKVPASKTASDLIALRNDLVYYNSHFSYSPFTAAQHEKNIAVINNNITDEFGTGVAGLLSAYLIKMDKDDDLNVLMKAIQNAYNSILTMKSVNFSTFRLKNMDNLKVQVKDQQGNIVRDEDLRLSGGLKIDFSAGLGITGLRDYNYFIKDTTVAYFRDTASGTPSVDTSGKIVRRENDGKYDLRFAIFMHAYYRLSSNYNAAITVGVSTNTNLDINLIAGGSLLLGSNRRLVLTYGAIFGKVNRLSNSVQEGYHTTTAARGVIKPTFLESGTSVVPMVKQWQHSWFVGVSWNFTN